MGKKGRKNSFIKMHNSAYMNQLTFIDYYSRLKSLALNLFVWKNLPPTIDKRWLEITLYEQGAALFFEDEVVGPLALPCIYTGPLDVYNIPIRRQAYASNGYRCNRTSNDSILCFNNYTRRPTAATLRLFAYRMADVQRTIDINLQKQKNPYLLRTTPQQELTIKNILMDMEGNESNVFVDKSFSPEDVFAIPLTAPYITDKLEIEKHLIMKEALTFLGIENSMSQKKERENMFESQAEYGSIEANRNVMLNARKDACEKANLMFGWDIDVEYNSDLITMINRPDVYSASLKPPEQPKSKGVGGEGSE